MAHSTLARPESDLSLVLNSFITRIVNKPVLGRCSFVSPESSRGACDGGHECGVKATVHDLQSDREFCAGHFRAVLILRALEVGRG
jgi:hypothetical protein